MPRGRPFSGRGFWRGDTDLPGEAALEEAEGLEDIPIDAIGRRN